MGKKKKNYIRTCTRCGNEQFSLRDTFVCCYCRQMNKPKRDQKESEASEH